MPLTSFLTWLSFLRTPRHQRGTCGQDVFLVGGVDIGVLSLAGPAAISHGGPQAGAERAGDAFLH